MKKNLTLTFEESTKIRDELSPPTTLPVEDVKFSDVLNRSFLSPDEIWSMQPESFYRWRNKYDYPRILSHFSLKLNEFNEWKAQFGIDDRFLIKHGISECISKSNYSKKDKYIFASKENPDLNFLMLFDISGFTVTDWKINQQFSKQKQFLSYFDWCDYKKILAFNGGNDLFSQQSQRYYDSLKVETSILDGLLLLDIGGCTVYRENRALKAKHFEFVSACNLTLKGQLIAGNEKLSFNFSIMENFTCDKLDFAFCNIRNCLIENISIRGSILEQWHFENSKVTGTISDSQLKFVSVIKGKFTPILNNTRIASVNATEMGTNETYQLFKKVYAEQGDDENAVKYYLKEKEFKRAQFKKDLFSKKEKSFSFKIHRFQKGLWTILNRINSGLLFFQSSISNSYWGYGKKPYRVIIWSLFVIVFFSMIYQMNEELLNKPGTQNHMSFLDSLYYSGVTFTTLGYGDYTPKGYLRLLAGLESLFGGMSIGFMVAGFSNLKY